MKQLTLFELHQFIQRVFYLNFEDNVWIEAEIAESRLNNGHIYMTLVEKNPKGQLIAKASCALWRSKAVQLKKKLGAQFQHVVKAGNKVRINCKVEFHPRYGYSLHIEDFDPAYTEGYLFLEKRKAIAKLKEAGLFDLNKTLELPLVIKRIAVISSPSAAGYQDFIHQLTSNMYDYTFHFELFPSTMQGEKVQKQFIAALQDISDRQDEFDVIVVVRGGGASVDLSDFDDYEVAAAVAQSPLPVLAGIGHERDTSVTDMVAFNRVKTPTAAAEMLIDNNLQYENDLREIYLTIRERIREQIHIASQDLTYSQQSFGRSITSFCENERFQLEKQSNSMMHLSGKILHHEQLDLQQLRMWVIENNPFHIMRRGYAMVFQEQKRITDLDSINKEQPISIIMDHQKITINEKPRNT